MLTWAVRLARGGLFQSEDVQVVTVRARDELDARREAAHSLRMTLDSLERSFRVSVRLSYPGRRAL